jgi:fatty acid desaturase
VSAFAAGCGVCGADLEAHHRRARMAAAEEAARPKRWYERIDLPRPQISPLESVYLAVTVFAVIVLALLGALHGFYEDRWWLMALFAALAALALGIETSQL